VPPVVWSVAVNGTPTALFGSDVVVMVRVAGRIVNVRTTVAVCGGLLESVTWNVTVPADGFVGVPVIWPVALFSVKPAGKRPEITVQEYGATPARAVRVWENGVPTTPVTIDVVAMVTWLTTLFTTMLSIITPHVG